MSHRLARFVLRFGLAGLLLVGCVLVGCASGGLPPETVAPGYPSFPVTATDGAPDAPPVFSWPGGGVREITVAEVDGPTVWHLVAGEREGAGRVGEGLIESPVTYGASSPAPGAPRAVVGPGRLVPGTRYTVEVRRLPGSHTSGPGPAGPPRAGDASFTVSGE